MGTMSRHSPRCSALSMTAHVIGSGASISDGEIALNDSQIKHWWTNTDSGNCQRRPHGDMHSQRPTDEMSSESRMREIRLSGLMRGRERLLKLTITVCLTQPALPTHSTADSLVS